MKYVLWDGGTCNIVFSFAGGGTSCNLFPSAIFEGAPFDLTGISCESSMSVCFVVPLSHFQSAKTREKTAKNRRFA
jgi:hypothetical protein